MELQLVSKEVAILAKELGCKEGPQLLCFEWNHKKHRVEGVHWQFKNMKEIMALSELRVPTQELLAKWLRDIRRIQVQVTNCNVPKKGKWIYEIAKLPVGMIVLWSQELAVQFDSYEEAMEIGLNQALGIILNSK